MSNYVFRIIKTKVDPIKGRFCIVSFIYYCQYFSVSTANLDKNDPKIDSAISQKIKIPRRRLLFENYKMFQSISKSVLAMLDFNSFCLLIQSNFDEIYNHQKCLGKVSPTKLVNLVPVDL